jgi:uncharacterized protein YkwD
VFLLPALVIATVAFGGGLPGVPVVPLPPGVGVPPSTACASDLDLAAPAAAQQRAMRCLVNGVRASAGVRPLRRSWRLDRAALLRARAIRRCDQFSHRPCGQAFIGVFVRSGYLGSGYVGENLAWGSAPLGTARDTVTGWLGSAEHRGNILYSGWRDVGVAELKAPSLFGAASVTLWVVQFGRH